MGSKKKDRVLGPMGTPAIVNEIEGKKIAVSPMWWEYHCDNDGCGMNPQAIMIYVCFVDNDLIFGHGDPIKPTDERYDKVMQEPIKCPHCGGPAHFRDFRSAAGNNGPRFAGGM